MRPPSPICVRLAPSSSARPTCTSSRSARRTKTPRYGPARNPHDPQRSPGGSSGGSAVSVATGMALATIGTDTGGSIRIPAAACGIVGLKPSFGDVSTDGVVPLSRTFDHVGPLTQTVTDAWLVYRGLLGGAIGKPPAPAPLSTLRIGVPRGYFCDVLDDEVRARFEEALEALRRAGARIDEIEIRHARDVGPVYLQISVADAAAYHAATLETVPERYTPNVRMRLEMGRYLSSEDYARALVGREVLRREVDAALAGRDALAVPTLPIPAAAHRRGDDQGRRDGGAGAQPDAAADVAVQRDRTSGDCAAERHDLIRPAVLDSADRSTRAHRRPAACRADGRRSSARQPRIVGALPRRVQKDPAYTCVALDRRYGRAPIGRHGRLNIGRPFRRRNVRRRHRFDVGRRRVDGVHGPRKIWRRGLFDHACRSLQQRCPPGAARVWLSFVHAGDLMASVPPADGTMSQSWRRTSVLPFRHPSRPHA